jgi:hypothetical protein
MGRRENKATLLMTEDECKGRKTNLDQLCNLFCASTVLWKIRAGKQRKIGAGFEDLTAVIMNLAFFWIIALCSPPSHTDYKALYPRRKQHSENR